MSREMSAQDEMMELLPAWLCVSFGGVVYLYEGDIVAMVGRKDRSDVTTSTRVEDNDVNRSGYRAPLHQPQSMTIVCLLMRMLLLLLLPLSQKKKRC